MLRRSPILRISFGLISLTVAILLVADVLFGLTPDHMAPALDARKKLIESMAVQSSQLAGRGDMTTIESTLEALVDRNPDVLSAALRKESGELAAKAGDHRRHWVGAPRDGSTPTHARVTIFSGPNRWGTLEVRFVELASGRWARLAKNPFLRALVFLTVFGFIAYVFFMRRTLAHLDPSSVIPPRVQQMLDVFAEGVVLLDEDERIVMVNAAFSRFVSLALPELMGKKLSQLGWTRDEAGGKQPEFPWIRCLEGATPGSGLTLRLATEAGKPRALSVNVAPVAEEDGQPRGAVVTFDDVTEIERTNEELRVTVEALEASQGEIRRQNDQLVVMATRDPLTHCLNRRALVDALYEEFEHAKDAQAPLSCIMADIDKFKSVNDTFGHVVGDKVIQVVAQTLRDHLRTIDIIGRYGGEEFCIVLPGASLEDAVVSAERLRRAIEDSVPPDEMAEAGARVTSSFGVATVKDWDALPMEVVDEADGALYTSKENGRNRVTAATELATDEYAAA